MVGKGGSALRRIPGRLRGFASVARVAVPVLLVAMTSAVGLRAADLTAREMARLAADPERLRAADFSGKDLSALDLSGLNLHGATLVRTNLFGADLSHANLSAARLAGARLDRVVIIGTSFEGADLSFASLLRVATSTRLTSTRDEAPNFSRAQLVGIRLVGRFAYANFSQADLSDARIGLSATVLGERGLMMDASYPTDLTACNLAGARLVAANLSGVRMPFASLAGAILRGAILRRADLSGADLTGADLTGADLSGATLDGAILADTKGVTAARNQLERSP
jgi:uncharacterized protein YjbI with pentapeptide repeats